MPERMCSRANVWSSLISALEMPQRGHRGLGGSIGAFEVPHRCLRGACSPQRRLRGALEEPEALEGTSEEP